MTTVYVDPQTIHNPAAGGKPPATWGDTVRDDLEFLIAPPMVKVGKSATQSISTSTATAVTWDLEDWDTDAFHSTSSNTSRLTVPTGFGGRYLIIGQVKWGASTVNTRLAFISVSGAGQYGRAIDGATASGIGYRDQTVMAELQLAAGAYAELIVWQDSGGAVTVDPTGGTGHMSFQMRWVSRS